MSKAKETHYKAVIAADNQEPPKDYCISAHADHFNGFVEGYIEGYHQAEKDLKLTWEDIRDICNIQYIVLNEYNDYNEPQGNILYQEVLKRFQNLKNLII